MKVHKKFGTANRISANSVADPGCFSRIRLFPTPDPGSELSKNLSILTPKKSFLSSRKYDPGCSSRIRMLTFYPSRIPDPGVKKAPDPGSATLYANWKKILVPQITNLPHFRNVRKHYKFCKSATSQICYLRTTHLCKFSSGINNTSGTGGKIYGVIDIDGIPWLKNISTNFRKNS